MKPMLVAFVSCLAMCSSVSVGGQRQPRRDKPSAKCETVYLPRCTYITVYRSFDGICNNLEHPTWGSAGSVIRRLLAPEYEDASGQPRRSGKHGVLPSPRIISNKMKQSTSAVSVGVSQMHVLYGQLLAHDIVHIPVIKSSSGKGIKCDCEWPSKDCINIGLPADDPIRKHDGKTCLPLPRSKAAVPHTGCTFKYREQTTTMSSYIDGTFLYGKSDQEADDLRDPHSNAGELLLIMSPYGGPHKNLPKQSDLKNKRISSTIDCDAEVRRPANDTCFVSGDVRVGENIGLIAIQTAFARYHNWVARELKTRNPEWNSDKVYFEARKIISAIIQSITYREYLPPLLGPKYMKRFGLTLADKGFWNGYDSRYDASITSEFTTAALRYGHSQVASIIKMSTESFTPYQIIATRNSFFNSEPFQKKNDGGTGSILRGFMTENAEKTDTNFVDALRNHLFAHRGKPFGRDLFAINIQRGRDHGLSGYNNYREFCGLTRAKTFDDLRNDIPLRTRQQLQSLYHDVDDIDLYVGGLAENHVKGGVVGPTFACILSYTMRGLRRGDRLWHELRTSGSPFSLPQLESIRKIGLASILCQTVEDMKYVLTHPLRREQFGKDPYIKHCANVAKLNLNLWDMSRKPLPETSSSQTAIEWTSWFVTNIRNAYRVIPTREFARIKSIRGDGICNNFVNYQVRSVRHDEFLQIRFSCKSGTVFATDYPFQASDEYKWTRWIEKQSVSRFELQCNRIIAIQAKTIQRDMLGLETGDVFEKFGPDGFSCKDRHQVNGRCHRYKVRALCSGSYIYTFVPATKAPPIRIAVRDRVKKHANLLCKYYNICCESTRISYSNHLNPPTDVRQAAKSYCKTYNVCCDA